MRNTRQKGIFYERIVCKILEQQGYTTCRACWKPLYIKGRLVLTGADIHGCDIVAIHPQKNPYFIQVTCSSNIKQKLQDLMARPFNLQHTDIAVWQYSRPKSCFKVYKIKPDKSYSCSYLPVKLSDYIMPKNPLNFKNLPRNPLPQCPPRPQP